MPYIDQRFQTPINILVVDDSPIIRRVMTNTLARHPDINMVAAVEDGQKAVDAVRDDPTIEMVLMDIEMPVMDGLTALPLLLKIRPKLKVMIISTLSRPNATVTMEALRLGAVDYMPKPSARDTSEILGFENELINKIRGCFADEKVMVPADPLANAIYNATANRDTAPKVSEPTTIAASKPYPLHPVHAVAIGSSTGGPQALQALFSQLKGHLTHLPIFITQHMPPMFTGILAEQLSQAIGRPCQEAEQEGSVVSGGVYVAPGNYHMEVGMQQARIVTRINQEPQVNYCRPAVDAMLPSLIKMYGKNLLCVMLTGMGQDGLEGCKALVQTGGSVIAQDKATSVVWGMPKAVAEAGICRQILPLNEIGDYLIHIGKGAR